MFVLLCNVISEATPPKNPNPQQGCHNLSDPCSGVTRCSERVFKCTQLLKAVREKGRKQIKNHKTITSHRTATLSVQTRRLGLLKFTPRIRVWKEVTLSLWGSQRIVGQRSVQQDVQRTRLQHLCDVLMSTRPKDSLTSIKTRQAP